MKEFRSNTKIFADIIEDTALNQIKELSESDAYKDTKIRIMPDCHAGSGCTIGTTMEIHDKITPNLVGFDIGCGMLVIELAKATIDLPKLDSIINEFVPHGFNVHNIPRQSFDFSKLTATGLNIERAKLSIGTLGGGNHFIEIDKNSKGNLFLVIHSGSRNIGAQVAKYHQKIALKKMSDVANNRNELISKLKQEGRESEIQNELSNLPKTIINKDLAYLQGTDFDNYMNDMKIMQQYASINRRTIANIIIDKMGFIEIGTFETIHNYIDFGDMILRKGAVSAKKDEILIIPINMRDGAIMAVGKGNSDWNYSAPHGAGRLMSRSKAFKTLQLSDFTHQMDGIYSTSVSSKTLDEAPDVYKPISSILNNIGDTVDVLDIIKPIYNFKSH